MNTVNLANFNRNKINNAVGFCEILNEYLHQKKLSEKKGGYLTIVDAETGTIVICTLIGEIPFEKIEKYPRLSMEKAQRVFRDKLSSSFQSRNPETQKWAGAIRGKEFIYSFSGHSEENDEVISLMLCFSNELHVPEEFLKDTRIGEIIRPAKIISQLMNSDVEAIRLRAVFWYEKCFPVSED